MFRIRVFTPPVTNHEGWQHAGGQLILDEARIHFLIDLRHWNIAAYERQWREGIARLVKGESSAALMTAYRGPGDEPHVMWGLWRDESHVYVQAHTVLPVELESAFDPMAPHAHIGKRIPASENGLPIPEWRIELVDLIASALGIRWPMYPR
jgi:CdiI N-terminal domain